MMDVLGHTIYNGKSPLDKDKIGRIVSQHDDYMVTKLRNLGAIVFGTTIMTGNDSVYVDIYVFGNVFMQVYNYYQSTI